MVDRLPQFGEAHLAPLVLRGEKRPRRRATVEGGCFDGSPPEERCVPNGLAKGARAREAFLDIWQVERDSGHAGLA